MYVFRWLSLGIRCALEPLAGEGEAVGCPADCLHGGRLCGAARGRGSGDLGPRGLRRTQLALEAATEKLSSKGWVAGGLGWLGLVGVLLFMFLFALEVSGVV